MTAPNNWEEFRKLFASAMLAQGRERDVPQRYGGLAEELFCWRQIGPAIRAMGKVKFDRILGSMWSDDAAGKARVINMSDRAFARDALGTRITLEETKAEWLAERGDRTKEDAEAAVQWGLSAMLLEEPA